MGTVLSVRAEARSSVTPDSAVLATAITVVRTGKAEALQAAATSLAEVTADLAGLGGVPLDATTGRLPLTWSAQSAVTHLEREVDERTGVYRATGRVVSAVVLRLAVRDFAVLDAIGSALARHEALDVQQVLWQVDDDNPGWPAVRAAAIEAALRKGRDYAAALGGTLRTVEHVADVGLLGGGDVGGGVPVSRGLMAMSASYPGEQADTPSLDPVPQELTATIEARFTTTGISLA